MLLKAASHSNPSSIAGALAGLMRENGHAEIQAIGAGAVSQAVKAIAIARGYVAPNGIDLVCVPAFVELEVDGNKKTGIKFYCMKR